LRRWRTTCRLAHLVLGKADFGRVRIVTDIARHRIIGRDLLLLRQQFERVEAPFSGYDLEAFASSRAHL
jgi:hypothetical protein